VKIIALLAFYDEDPGMLVRCMTSLSKCCDHVVALDGAYYLFPDGRRNSDPGATSAIGWGALLGMGVTLSIPEDVWKGNEVEKRNALFKLGNAIAEEGDWFLVVDADMVVESVPSDLRTILEGTDCEVGTYWLRDGEYGGRHPIRLFFRAAPDLHVSKTHYGYRRGDSYLWETGGMPAVPTDLIIEHVGHQRSAERNARGDEFDRRRDQYGIETANPQPIAEQSLDGSSSSVAQV